MGSAFYNQQGQLYCGWKLLLYYTAYVIALTVLTLPVFIVLQVCHRAAMLSEATPFLGALAGLGVSAVALKWEKRPFRSLGFALGGRWFKEFALGIVIGTFIVGVSALILHALGGFHWKVDSSGSLRNIGLGFLFFLAAGMDEEIGFRGYPFQLLLDWLGTWPALIVLAMPFAALHLSNPGISAASWALKILTVVNLALFALLLGLCYVRTRSLALPVGLHLGWNWVQGNLMGFGVSGISFARGFWTPELHERPIWLTGGAVGIEGSVVCTLIQTLAIVALIFWKTAAAAPSPAQSPEDAGQSEKSTSAGILPTTPVSRFPS